jgi:hypothetical protein
MKHLRAFGDFLNEDRRQLELPFDGKDPLHDKPVHVVDALEDLRAMPNSRYVTRKTMESVWDKAAETAYGDLKKNLDESSEFNQNVSYNFASQFQGDDLDDENVKKTFLDSFFSEEGIEETFDYGAVQTAQENIIRDIGATLTPEGIKDYEEYRQRYFANEFSLELYDNIESNIDEDGYINIWRSVVFNQVPTGRAGRARQKSMYKDVYLKIMKVHAGVGTYWTYDEEKPEAYWGVHGGPNNLELVLCAKVRVEDVDWVRTIYANAAMPEEKEISVKSTGNVMVYELRTEDYKPSKKEKGTFYKLEEPIVVPVGK